MDNYEILENGVIKQIKVNKIKYDIEYANKYNNYNEKSNYLSFLRLGVLIGNINKIPNSILDVGYGNGAFLKACSNIITDCNGYDITNYPLPENINYSTSLFDRHYDVISFFDSLEHFEDISIINNLDCDYIFISVPWCHNLNELWFLNWYHLRPNEHLWHFNDKSLITFFEENGYTNVYKSNFEDTIRKNSSLNGYPNILSCIFKKN
jgi:hypothetical protein